MPKKQPAKKPDAGEIQFFGEAFRMSYKAGSMPVLRFAKIASEGADASEMDSMVAMYDLIQACIDPADWARFEKTAMSNSADDDDLLGVVGQVLRAQAGRPTVRSSDSSGGPSATAPSSISSPADRVIARLDGRPDLQSYAAIEQKRALSAVS